MNTPDRLHVVCARCGAANRIPAARLAGEAADNTFMTAPGKDVDFVSRFFAPRPEAA